MWGKRPISISYWNSYLASRPVRIKQKKCIIHCLASWWFLLFYSPKPWSQEWILIYINWSIFQAYPFKGAVCLKGLSFVDFRPFFLKFSNYNVARILLEIKKMTPCIKLESYAWCNIFLRIFGWFPNVFFNVFNVWKWEGDV